MIPNEGCNAIDRKACTPHAQYMDKTAGLTLASLLIYDVLAARMALEQMIRAAIAEQVAASLLRGF